MGIRTLAALCFAVAALSFLVACDDEDRADEGGVAGAGSPPAHAGTPVVCSATPSEGGLPNFRANAPERSSVGSGHVMRGVVRSAEGCGPLPGAKIEFWLANSTGQYDDDHRATVIAGRDGAYRFESNLPGAYGGPGSAHIHLRVQAEGHSDLILTYILPANTSEANIDLVLGKV